MRARHEPDSIPNQGHGLSHAPLEKWRSGKSHYTPPQGSPSALPVAAPAPRGELSYGSLISGTAAASCVFLYFCFLPSAFFGAPPPHERYHAPQGAAICPAQRKNFCSRERAGRFVKAFCVVVRCTVHAFPSARFVDVLDQSVNFTHLCARHHVLSVAQHLVAVRPDVRDLTDRFVPACRNKSYGGEIGIRRERWWGQMAHVPR